MLQISTQSTYLRCPYLKYTYLKYTYLKYTYLRYTYLKYSQERVCKNLCCRCTKTQWEKEVDKTSEVQFLHQNEHQYKYN